MSKVRGITWVDGHCPVCGSRELFVIAHGAIHCNGKDCPDRGAITKLLADDETEHVVKLDAYGGVTVRHPLSERIANDLFSCGMLEHVFADHNNGNAPQEPGRYRVIYVGHDPVSSYLTAPMCTWERIP